VPPLVIGTAIGNLLTGTRFEADATLRATFAFVLHDFLNPLGLLSGLVGFQTLPMPSVGAQFRHSFVGYRTDCHVRDVK
jgi:cytochrome bd-type quinol oxidase subunit 2